MSSPDAELLASLAEGLRHIYVEPQPGYGDKFFAVKAAAEPRWPTRHSLLVTWLYANLKAGRVHIHFMDPQRNVETVTVSLDDFRQILLDAEKAIQVENSAAEIALERAAEVLAQRFQPDQVVFAARDVYEAELIFRRHYESDRYSFVSNALNKLLFDGEWVVHMKSVGMLLVGRYLSEEEVELLRLLAEDLAEIFDAPKIKKLKRLREISLVRAEAEVWREETRYREAEAGESP